MRFVLLAGLVSVLFFSGCASITQGTSQTLSFKLEPKETHCVLSRTGEGELGSISTSSNTIQVHKDKDDIIVQCTAPGYPQKTTRIVSGATTAGVTGVLLDFGITDMITGAMYAYPSDISIVLEKEPGGAALQTSEVSTSSQVAAIQTQEEKLKELKRLNDAGLISNEVYLERQKAVLSNP